MTVSFQIAPGSVRAVWTTELDRFVLASALRARHPHLTKSLQSLHDRLLPTADERERGLEFIEYMSKATREDREVRAGSESRRCIEEAEWLAKLGKQR